MSRERILIREMVRAKVRNICRHIVMEETLKTKASNFVLNFSLHWKPVKYSERRCCFVMNELPEDMSGCMIVCALNFMHLVVRETS